MGSGHQVYQRLELDCKIHRYLFVISTVPPYWREANLSQTTGGSCHAIDDSDLLARVLDLSNSLMVEILVGALAVSFVLTFIVICATVAVRAIKSMRRKTSDKNSAAQDSPIGIPLLASANELRNSRITAEILEGGGDLVRNRIQGILSPTNAAQSGARSTPNAEERQENSGVSGPDQGV